MKSYFTKLVAALAIASTALFISGCTTSPKVADAQTEITEISKEQAIATFLESNRPHIELKRPGTIDEVGPLVAFLASNQASFINGSNYRVDGGSVASV